MKTLQLVVTEGCNLSCDYCYMKNENTFMNRAIFVDYHKNLPDSFYKIAFFGGEPLKNWELVEFVTEYVRYDKRCKGLEIYSNGLLLDDNMASFILNNNIKFIWSCDGLNTGKTRNGASWNDYHIKADLLRKVVSDITVMISPENIEITKNHIAFVETFNVIPSFRIVRDNIWNADSVTAFRRGYMSYIKYLSECNDIPVWIEREFEHIIGAVGCGNMRTSCRESGCNECLMPDGSVHLCAKMATSTASDGYDGDLYQNCHTCDISSYCEKQCYEAVLKNGGVVSDICELYRIIFEGIFILDDIKTKKGDVIWKNMKIGLIK